MALPAMQVRANQPLSADPDWWRGAVIYQIYPRSFQDSNGDGVGDLQGIISRLAYVAGLGVDAIWISPIFRSPMLDFGYDVSDYRDIDPMFGSLEDFDQLLDRAHELGLRVIIDLAISHTSARHPWFEQSRASREGPKSNWYVWSDPKPDGTPPNNWLSIFGGSAWEWNGERMQYFLHNFLAEQPDLNFHEPEVQDELLDIARFWLDRGLDGFRLDTINFYFHDSRLRDNPALPPDERDFSTAPEVNPYNFQNHLYDKSRPEMVGFLRRLRVLMNQYPAIASVGEVGDAQRGMELMAEYTSGPDLMQMCYAFEFLSPELPSGTRVAEVLQAFSEVAADGWACWAFSNHDVERHRSRWGLDEASLRTFLALLLSLRGSVCLYQGEELGLEEAAVPFEALRDPYGKKFWPKFKGRDGCRTPMAWSRDQAFGGFSDSTPWLPVGEAHPDRSVDVQFGDDSSTLEFYRNMLAWRKRQLPLLKGSFRLTGSGEGYVAFVREFRGEEIFCAFNFSPEVLRVRLPEGDWESVPGSLFEATLEDQWATIPASQPIFVRSLKHQADGAGGQNG